MARWTGDAWEALGEGFSGQGVRALARLPDGSIVAAGAFQSIGGSPALNVARWDGSGWTQLGEGLGTSEVRTLEVDHTGQLYAGGSFSSSGAMPMRGIARWDGPAWQDVGGGVRGNVFAIRAMEDGEVIVAGIFNAMGNSNPPYYLPNSVANAGVWDGLRWRRAGSSVRNIVYTMTGLADGRTAFGGNIVSAGGQQASGVAFWRQVPNDPDINQDGNVDQDDVTALLDLIAQSVTSPALVEADFNCDGLADLRDLESLALVIAGGPMP